MSDYPFVNDYKRVINDYKCLTTDSFLHAFSSLHQVFTKSVNLEYQPVLAGSLFIIISFKCYCYEKFEKLCAFDW